MDADPEIDRLHGVRRQSSRALVRLVCSTSTAAAHFITASTVSIGDV